ncbi:hypothetical protein B0H34DRAFT_402867 [Crassisporium funariophilum]|nr:hypothetical protein B0H34DRAFT_402867 [Crassisporium funariophilum]
MTATLENTLGSALIGVFLNTYLYGITTFQYFSYFNTKFNDPLWIRGTVVSLYIIETFHSASLIYFSWHYTIVNFGNIAATIDNFWPGPFTIVITAVLACVTQLFLCYRILRLTKKTYLFAVGMIASLLSLALGMTLGIKTWLLKTMLEIPTTKPLMVSWLATEVAVDFFLSGILIYNLYKSRTGFERSDTVINRLIRTAIQTGVLSATSAMMTLALFVTMPDTQLYGLFGVPVARLYANTLLDTLLCRQYLRGILGQKEKSSTSYPTNSVQLHVRKDIQTELKFDEPGVGESSHSQYPTKYPMQKDSLDI